jgi:monofunctional biosynthetic peptidoglycan transglycosylase
MRCDGSVRSDAGSASPRSCRVTSRWYNEVPVGTAGTRRLAETAGAAMVDDTRQREIPTVDAGPAPAAGYAFVPTPRSEPQQPRAPLPPARTPPVRVPPPGTDAPPTRPPGVPARPPGTGGLPVRSTTRRQRVVRRFAVAALLAELVITGFIVSLRWGTPARTAFMLEGSAPVVYQYVSLDHVSRYLISSVIAHEDQQLGTRAGAVSLDALGDRASAYLRGKADPSGSTIPQQLAKNVFLWPGQDPVRKGAEAVLATEMTVALSDQRVVELYVNYAQFGPHLYGICAASWYYFGEAPWDMTEYQAAQLMGVLPTPDRVTRAAGGGIDTGPEADPLAVELVNGAANVHVPAEVAGMGGWRAAVATIGIHDTATDHAAGRDDPDACSTMPPSVAEWLARRDLG